MSRVYTMIALIIASVLLAAIVFLVYSREQFAEYVPSIEG
jgi:hypothetical protein